MKNRWLSVVLVVLVATSAVAHGQNHTNQGATLGGIAGAIAGAAIGKQNDETAAGALIGGALGLMTGATIGNARDAELARARAYQQHRQLQLSRAVTTQDVVTMTHGGLGDQLIVNHIHQNGVHRRLEVPDVISLHRQGVSEAVITALQRAPLAQAYAAPAFAQSPPIVVEQHHYVAPPHFYRPTQFPRFDHPGYAHPRYHHSRYDHPRYPSHYPQRHYRPRSGSSLGIRIGF